MIKPSLSFIQVFLTFGLEWPHSAVHLENILDYPMSMANALQSYCQVLYCQKGIWSDLPNAGHGI